MTADVSTPDGQLALATRIAHGFAKHHPADVDDFAQDGVIGMLSAPAYDAARGVPLPAYLATKARFAMVDALRSRRGWCRDTRQFSAVVVGFDEIAELAIEGDPDEGIARDQRAARVRRAIAALPIRERKLIVRYYYREQTHKQIGHVLGGVTEGRVSQLHKRALARLREALRED